MRKIFSSLLIISLFFGIRIQTDSVEAKETELEGTITISGAWALYPMTVKWAEEFQKIHPEVRIDVSAGGAGKGMADALAQIVDIGLVSREIHPDEIKNGAWWIPVTKDAVVPTVNDNNPLLKQLLITGMKKESFINIWITEKIKDWKETVPNSQQVSQKTAIHVYTRSDACGAAEIWAKFLDKKQEDLTGIGIYGDPGVSEAVRKDTLGIGFNNINYAYDSKTKMQINGIKILPIDINGNGKIDKDEDFYNKQDDLVKAIAAGKYPSPPARDLYFVSKGAPQKKVVTEFIKWILTEGQKYILESGYINLSKEKLKEALQKL